MRRGRFVSSDLHYYGTGAFAGLARAHTATPERFSDLLLVMLAHLSGDLVIGHFVGRFYANNALSHALML